MSTAISRTHAKQNLDDLAFVDSIREINQFILRIVPPVEGRNGLQPTLRKELDLVLRELEATVRGLRGATVETSAGGQKKAAPSELPPVAHGDGGAALVLDSTAVMVSRGQLVTPGVFQELMGWSTRQALSKAAKSQRIFSLTHKAQRYFPTFFADPTYDRRHLEMVSKAMGDLPGGSKLQFFLTRKGSLGGETPLQALAAGRVAKVKDIAAAFAQEV